MPGMTLSALRDDLLRKLGYESPGEAPASALEDIATALNWALQTMSQAGDSWFLRETLALTLVSGTSVYELPDSVRSVLGPVRSRDGRGLRRLEARGEVNEYGRIYLGQYTRSLTIGPVQAYFVEHGRKSGADSHAVRIFVVPAPDAQAVLDDSPLDVEGVTECPAYTAAQLSTSTVVPVADQYTESILLPLARLAITRSELFSRPDTLARIEADAAQATRALGPLSPAAREAKAKEGSA